MMRLINPMLFLVLIFCAIKVIESRYLSRIRYNDLYQAEKTANQYKLLKKQLELEQSTLAAGVEAYAKRDLAMQRPDASRIQEINLSSSRYAEAKGAEAQQHNKPPMAVNKHATNAGVRQK